jgi:hypothetical protein
MPTPENPNTAPEQTMLEQLEEKRRSNEVIYQQLKEARQYREDLKWNVHHAWVLHLVASMGIAYFCIFNYE